MRKTAKRFGEEDWRLIRGLLPEGWQAMASQSGAVRRMRGLYDPERLLRALLAHVADGCSLVETALRVQEAGWGQVSAVALFKHLQAAERWLRWIAQRLFQRHHALEASGGRRVLVVDATTVKEAGPTGSLWRVHWLVNLEDLQCEHYELTDVRGGETLRRMPLKRGDIILGDRAYGRGPGVAAALRCGADVLVRVDPHVFPLYSRPQRRLSLLRRLRCLRHGQLGQWEAWTRTAEGQWLQGRLVVVRRSRAATRRAQRHARRRAQRKRQRLSRRTMELAGYVLVWTTLAPQEYPARRVLRLYRLRWQIELVFKRMKSIMGLGQLPKHSDASARAWLHGKLLVVLLLERLWEEAETRTSPQGMLDPKRRSRWRELRLLLRELVVVLVPPMGLSRVLRRWDQIRRRLADPPRRRTRAILS